MFIVEKVLDLLAPHHCIICGKTGSLLCSVCQQSVPRTPSRCHRCHKVSRQFQTCSTCRSKTGLSRVWVVTMYESAAKELLEALKFQRAGAASQDIAQMMVDILPILPENTIITHAPTARSRIRQRGYDQSQLIAKDVARSKQLTYKKLFFRLSPTRQLGAGRELRFKQAAAAFTLRTGVNLESQSVLIVDDVTTSGATLEALAKICKSAGAKEVSAIVFAQALD